MRPNNKLRIRLASGVLVLGLLLSGCNIDIGNPLAQPTGTPSAAVTATPEPAGAAADRTPTAVISSQLSTPSISASPSITAGAAALSTATISEPAATPVRVPADQLPVAPPRGIVSKKDTLVLAMSQEPASLFPLYETSVVAQTIADALFDGLVSRDTRDNLYPEDAWYVPSLENGGAYYVGQGDQRHLVVKYEIRPGLKWSDGQEITSADALFTYNLIMDPNSTIQDPTLWEKVHDVQTPDKYTVVFNFMSAAQAADFYSKAADKEHFAFLKPFADAKQPVVDPLYNMVGASILPEHSLKKIPADKILQTEYARNPVGNGPFKVERWDAGSQIVLAPNPDYTLTAPPLLKKIIIKIVTDPNQIITQLRTGDLDAATSDAFPAPTQALDNLASSGQTVVYVPSRQWEHIDFNLDDPQFQDKTVRQAILYGINRQNLVDKLYGGKSIVLNTFIPPASWASMQNADFAGRFQGKFSINDYKFDPAKANQMLDAAGWVKGSNGIRSKGDVKLTFEYSTTADNKLREQATQLVTADLKNIGVLVTTRFVNSDQYFAGDGTLASRAFDFGEYSWVLQVDPTGALYDSQYIPSAGKSYLGANYPGWKNARFDQLSRAAANEPDRSKRAPMFAEMQQIWNDELPALPLFTGVHTEVHKTNLINWDTSAGTTYPTYRIAAMYFK